MAFIVGNGSNAGASPSWSFSRWDSYRQCAKKYKAQYIDNDKRLKEPRPAPGTPETPMQRGDRIHKLGEAYLKGKLAEVPEEFNKFAESLQLFKSENASSEEAWAFDENWEPCEYWDRSVVNPCRMKIDTHVVVEDGFLLKIVDFKTGKTKDFNIEPQLELLAIGGMIRYPEVKRVEAEFWFIDSGDIRSLVYGGWQKNVLMANWKRRTKNMFNDTEFAASPGPFCQWCLLAPQNGGDCASAKVTPSKNEPYKRS